MTNVANWVEQETTTTGTGPVTVSGSIDGSTTWVQAFGSGITEVYYSIESGNNRETGVGSFNGTTNVLTRTTITSTLVSGIYDDTTPTAVNLTGTSTVRGTFNAGALINDAPDNQSRTYFRDGTTRAWTRELKGYGEITQSTATASVGETINVEDGNYIISALTGAYTLTALTTTIACMSATWQLGHNGQTVSFPASFNFAGGTPPAAQGGNTWILGLFTSNGGTDWIVTYVENYTL